MLCDDVFMGCSGLWSSCCANTDGPFEGQGAVLVLLLPRVTPLANEDLHTGAQVFLCPADLLGVANPTVCPIELITLEFQG